MLRNAQSTMRNVTEIGARNSGAARQFPRITVKCRCTNLIQIAIL